MGRPIRALKGVDASFGGDGCAQEVWTKTHVGLAFLSILLYSKLTTSVMEFMYLLLMTKEG